MPRKRSANEVSSAAEAGVPRSSPVIPVAVNSGSHATLGVHAVPKSRSAMSILQPPALSMFSSATGMANPQVDPKALSKNDPEYVRLLRERESFLASLLSLRDESGCRPRAPAPQPAIEKRKQERSLWTNVLAEMNWMATDFSQERAFKASQRAHISLALSEHRARRKRTKAAIAMEKFWEAYGGQVDGRPQAPNVQVEALQRKPPDEPMNEPLFPSLAGIDVQAMSVKQRLLAVRKLMISASSKAKISFSSSPYFNGTLSPVQFHTLKRIAQLTRFGLGAVVADSDKADHRTTISSLIAFLASELEVCGPHLICCSEPLDLVYYQAVIAIRCPEMRVVSLPGDTEDGNGESEMNGNGSMQFGPKDVVICHFNTAFSTLSSVEVDWGAVVYSLGISAYGDPPPLPNATAVAAAGGSTGGSVAGQSSSAHSDAGSSTVVDSHGGVPLPPPSPVLFTLPQLPQSQRWGRPIFVLNGQLSSIFSKNHVSNAILYALGLEVHQLSDVVASSSPSLFAAHIREDADFPLMEMLVACSETSDQTLKRRAAKGDVLQQELVATHANPQAAAAFASAWSTDPIPPPRRQYSSSLWTIDAITRQSSGKFVEAMNLILSHRCRRAVIISSKKVILDAFAAVASLNVICYRMDVGTLHSRIASWVRFLDTDFGCILARPIDLEKCPSRKMNGAVDSVILLDCYTSDADVARIRAMVKHAMIYRLFTRDTLEQRALESAQHPCLVQPSASSTSSGGNQGLQQPQHGGAGPSSTTSSSASSNQPLVAAVPTDFRVIQRTYEIDQVAAAGDSAVNEDADIASMESVLRSERYRPIREYAFGFSTGASGSRAYHGSLNGGAVARDTNAIATVSGPTLEELVPLYYDPKLSRPQLHQTVVPPQRGKGSALPPASAVPPSRVATALKLFDFQRFGDDHKEELVLPLDQRRFLISFGQKRGEPIGGTTSPPLQPKKKQKFSSSHSGAANFEDNGPSLSLPTPAVGSSAMSSSGTAVLSGAPFTAIEDDVIREVMDRYGFHTLLAAEVLNGSQIFRHGVNGARVTSRNASDVLNRYGALQRTGALTASLPKASTLVPGGVEEIDLTFAAPIQDEDPQQYSWFVPPSDLPPNEVRRAAQSRFDFWGHRPQKIPSFNLGSANGEDLLQAASATSEHRIGPLQLMTAKPGHHPAVPPGSAAAGAPSSSQVIAPPPSVKEAQQGATGASSSRAESKEAVAQ